MAGQGHLGSSLSIVEILTRTLRRRFDDPPVSDGRDYTGERIVLSKGHAALGLYCALAEVGALAHAELASFGRNGSALEPHPNERLLPAVAVSTGSLGQGLSVGVGLAHGSRIAGRPLERTAVILGDGELNEGQPWEAAMAAVHLGLGNLIAIVDVNGLQQDGSMDDVMPIGDFAAAWAAIGWQVHTVDGHDCGALKSLLVALRDASAETPKLIVARTVKARGVPFLENTVESHYPPPLDGAELDLIARQLMRGGSDGF